MLGAIVVIGHPGPPYSIVILYNINRGCLRTWICALMNKKVRHIYLDGLIYLKTGGVSVLWWNSNFSMVFCASSWVFFYVVTYRCWIPLLQECFVHRLLVFGILQVQIVWFDVWFINLLPSNQHGLKSGIHCQL